MNHDEPSIDHAATLESALQVAHRTTHNVLQGSGDWLRLRRDHLTASEAPAALGHSKFTSRASLLRAKHTGMEEEPDAAALGRFAAGHAAEARARPLAEALLGQELYPVTLSAQVQGLPLLASLDGITLDDTTLWETKLWNEELAAHVRVGTLPEQYLVQMDQQLLVSGAQRCLFTCTDGTPERFVHCWHHPSRERFEALVAGWRRFLGDLAVYTLPPAAEPAPAGRAPDTLPALRIELTGAVTASNLADFKATALGAIRAVNRTLKTDQDFADAERAVKWCAEVEQRLKAAKDHALSQTADIEALFRALDDIAAEAKAARLDLDKLVTRRKAEVKEEAVMAARRALDAHIAEINAELAPMRLQPVAADFAAAIKGLRSLESLHNALGTALAQAKIQADGQARGIRANVAAFQALALAEDFGFLFRDLDQLVHKAADDFAAVVRSRIAEHKAAEAAKEAKRQAEEAARIAAAERRAAAEAEARVRAEQEAQARREREAAAAEARAAEQRQQAAQAAQAAPAPHAAQPAPPPSSPAQPAAASAPAAGADEPATLRLGDICERLGFTLSAGFLAGTLHIHPARTDGAAKLYRPSDFARLCQALQAHLGRVAARAPEAHHQPAAQEA